jgi:hypothetical protein
VRQCQSRGSPGPSSSPHEGWLRHEPPPKGSSESFTALSPPHTPAAPDRDLPGARPTAGTAVGVQMLSVQRAEWAVLRCEGRPSWRRQARAVLCDESAGTRSVDRGQRRRDSLPWRYYSSCGSNGRLMRQQVMLQHTGRDPPPAEEAPAPTDSGSANASEQG